MIYQDSEYPLELTEISEDMLTPEEEEELVSGYIPERDDSPLSIKPTERRLVTQPYDLVVRTIVGQIDDTSLLVRPPYQRGYVWDNGRASRLIESLLMNIPIPACYFAEEDNGTHTVIDGQQRLYSIWRYVNNQFRLRGLRTLVEFSGKAFRDLSEREQRIVLGRTIRCIIVTQESHPEIRFEVFERLNTGSMQLTDQEIRNAIYRGDFNDLIKSLAEQPRWLEALSKRRLDKRMRDDELVLRFFAMHDRYLSYQAPLRSFLTNYAASKRGSLAPVETDRLTSLFENTVDKVIVVFSDHAFRTFSSTNNRWETQVNRALFDAVMLVVANLPLPDLQEKRVEINEALKDLCRDQTFLDAVSLSTADRTSVTTRIRLFSEALHELGLDSGIHQSLPVQP